MAEIVLGLASSHSPQLSSPPETWALRGEGDKKNPHLRDFSGKKCTYEDLLATASPSVAQELTAEKFQSRHDANQRGIAKVREALYRAEPDVVVMFGDDQYEVFKNDNMPPISVYWGDTVRYTPTGASVWPYPSQPRADVWSYGERQTEFPVASKLATHIIGSLIEDEFDISHSQYYPEGVGMSHAFTYVYWRIMNGGDIIPTIPIHVNTYFPPNQPTPKRCYELGKALRRAVESWDSQARVAVFASGGLSHFLVDEELDHQSIEALQSRDPARLTSIPREKLNSGNSEFRNWIATAGATEHLDFEMFDYVPCYRSSAGTGCAMGFAQWA